MGLHENKEGWPPWQLHMALHKSHINLPSASFQIFKSEPVDVVLWAHASMPDCANTAASKPKKPAPVQH